MVLLEGEYENNNNLKMEEDQRPWTQKISGALKVFLDRFGKLCSQPYVRYLGITSFADFGLMARQEIPHRFKDF